MLSSYFMRLFGYNLLKYKALWFILLWQVITCGCQHNNYYNRAGFVHKDTASIKFSQDKTWQIFFKTTYFYPVRDWFDCRYQWGRITGKPLPASNLIANGQIENSSFYTNRPIEGVKPEIIACGPNSGPNPQDPFKILKIKESGGSRGFIGKDKNGYKYLIKLDDSSYPELGSTAEIVASRIYWALGYYVPQTYLITVIGTGDERFDGKRAIASRFVSGEVLGIYKYDWVKDRREFRGLKLAAMWFNDVDRSDNNNLAAVSDELVRFYMLDFNGALGSWQGRAKEKWQGCRYCWDVEKQLQWVFTLGLGTARGVKPALQKTRGVKPHPTIESKSLGYMSLEFEPLGWRGEKPNTAFDRMTEEDASWMAGKIGRFSREQLKAIIAQARLSDPEDAQMLLEALLARRKTILRQYPKYLTQRHREENIFNHKGHQEHRE